MIIFAKKVAYFLLNKEKKMAEEKKAGNDVKYDGWGNPIVDEPKGEEKPEVKKRGRKPGSKNQKTGEKKEKPVKVKKTPEQSEQEKFRKKLIKKGETLPELSSMFLNAGHATKVKVKDIAIFISMNKRKDAVIDGIKNTCPFLNVVNYDTEVSSNRVLKVMREVLNAGKFFFDIEIAELKEDGVASYQCVSGRHRLAGIALLWGPDAEVPVVIKKGLTLKEARLMTVYANNTRGIGKIEKTMINISERLGGDVAAISTDDGYAKAVNSKTSAKDYILWMLSEGKVNVGASVQLKGDHTVKDSVYTVSSVEAFFGSAICYTKGDTKREFEKQVRDAAAWLKKLYEALCKESGFVLREHCSKRALGFYGHLYNSLMTAGDKADDFGLIASRVVRINGMGSLSKEEILKAYQKILREAVKN